MTKPTKIVLAILTISIFLIVTQTKPDTPDFSTVKEALAKSEELTQNAIIIEKDVEQILTASEQRYAKLIKTSIESELETAKDLPQVKDTEPSQSLANNPIKAFGCWNKNIVVEVNMAQLPVRNSCVTSIFGARQINGKVNSHEGMDMRCRGTDYQILAVIDGKVIDLVKNKTEGGYSKRFAGQDNYIAILSNDIVTTYRHLAKNSVKIKIGQEVKAGTQIGICGTTGLSTGDHSHIDFKTVSELGKKYKDTNFTNPNQFYKIK